MEPEQITEYFENLPNIIEHIFNREQNNIDENSLDILDPRSPEQLELMEQCLKRTQKTMKYGEVWQVAMGKFPGWIDLGIGHESECDVKKEDNTVIIELKNKWNTTNSGGKKDVERKLSNYKINNPETMCIWGIINEKTNNKKHREDYIVNNVEITKWQGSEFMSFVFTYNGIDYSSRVIEELRRIIHHS